MARLYVKGVDVARYRPADVVAPDDVVDVVGNAQ